MLMSLLVLFLNGKQFRHSPRTNEILCSSFRSGIYVTMADILYGT